MTPSAEIRQVVALAHAVHRAPVVKTIPAVAVALGLLAFAAAPASAQETVASPDGARFRIGVAAEGGASLETKAPSFRNASGPSFGFELEMGAQINDRIGVFAAPECSAGGVGFGCRLAVMGEVTVDRGLFSIGAGPEVGGLLFGSSEGGGIDGLTLVGGRARLALHLFERKESEHPRQRAFTVGLDVHVDGGSAGVHQGNDQVPSTLLVAPMLTVGYLWF